MFQEKQQKDHSTREPLKIDAPDSAHEKAAESVSSQIVNGDQLMGSAGAPQGHVMGNGQLNPGITAPGFVRDKIANAKGSGEQLNQSEKKLANGQAPNELDEVRVHTDSRAAELAKAVNAKAFAYGKDIFFGQGQYDSTTTEGKQLIAHELVHTQQYGGWGSPRIQRSAVIEKNDADKQVNINSTMVFYGYEATDELGKAAADEIQTMWNEPAGKVNVGTESYDLKFRTGYEVVSIDKAMAMAKANTSDAVNFIRVEKNNKGGISFMKKLGANSGHFATKDGIGKSTTAAHEYGHGLGLDHHVVTNWVGKGSPSIMVPRSGNYQVDEDARYSNWETTGYWGVNPYKRKVLTSDIDDLKMDDKIKNGASSMGKADNTLFDSKGNEAVSSEALHVDEYASGTASDTQRSKDEIEKANEDKK